MKYFFTLCLVLIAFNAYSVEVVNKIPEKFQGKWIDYLNNCEFNKRIGSYHPNMMQISLESISYFESRGKAVSIVTRDKNEIALILHLYFEGENALIFKHFILSEDGKSLSVVDDDLEIESIYYRCPD